MSTLLAMEGQRQHGQLRDHGIERLNHSQPGFVLVRCSGNGLACRRESLEVSYGAPDRGLRREKSGQGVED